MANKTHDEIFQRWVEFWLRRGSLFVKEKINTINPEKLLRSEKIPDEEKLNLFFSINGYKIGTKSREEKNLSKLNAFFFDIDLKEKNEGIMKKEAWKRIEPFADHFDFIAESGGGYHLYILMEDKYGIDDMDTYLSDWKQKGSELEKAIGLAFDPATYLSTQIARICGSLHQKKASPVVVKLIKGEELLFPLHERQRAIDSVPITQVLEALNIDYQDDRIFEDGRLTNGRKINLTENYINDFSSKGRPVGGPFSFVKHWYMKNQIANEKDAIIKTYCFFTDKFGIIQSKLRQKTIAIPEVMERWIVGAGLSGKEIQTLLSLISYSRDYFEKQIPYGTKITAYVSDILKTTGLSDNASNYVKTLKTLEEKANNLFITGGSTKNPVLNIKTKKVFNSRMVEFSILPDWYGNKKARGRFYHTHYVKKKLFEIQTKSEDLRFYLKLSNEFVSVRNDFTYEVKKKEICDFFGDENFTRIKKKIQKIQSITQDFSITTTGGFIQFKKA